MGDHVSAVEKEMEALIGLAIFLIVIAFVFDVLIPVYILPFLASIAPILAIAAVAYGIFLYLRFEAKTRKDAEERRKQLEDQKRAEAERILEERRRLAARIEGVVEEAIKESRKSVEHAEKAEKHLQQSITDFDERALYPFWDQIAACASELSGIKACVARIDHLWQSYVELRPQYKGVVPDFPVSRETIRALAAREGTVNRLKAITRNAHKDRDFAGIFAVHKTNQILVAGFSSLASALDDISFQIRSQTEHLVSALEEVTTEVRRSGELVASRISDVSTAVERVEHSSRSSNQALEFNGRKLTEINHINQLHDKKMIQMLDNIQRNEKPPPKWLSN